jgi:drug/metabolite transporter (DMT)-like permease
MPVTALIVSALVLGEVVGPWRLAGGALVVLAIVLGTTEKYSSKEG